MFRFNKFNRYFFRNFDFIIKIADLSPIPSFFTGIICGFGYLQAIDYNDDNKMDFIFSGGDSVFLYMQNETGDFNYFTIMRLPGVADKEDGGWYMDDLRSGGIAIGEAIGPPSPTKATDIGHTGHVAGSKAFRKGGTLIKTDQPADPLVPVYIARG